MDQNIRTENEIAKYLTDIFDQENIRFSSEAFKNGLVFDFLIFSPDGRQAVIETKAWKK